MSKATCDNYLELLQVSSNAWSSDDDSTVNSARQAVLDHLVIRCEVNEADIAHLR